jgi:Spy/CpxP family protein refolding chaperone
MRKLSALALILGILLAQSQLDAQESKDPVPETWEGIKEKLQLSDEQMLRVREIKERNTVDLANLKQKLDSHVAELKRMLEQEPADRQRIEQLVQEVGRLQTQRVRVQTHTIYEIRSILNPEQKRILKSFRRGTREGGSLEPEFTVEKAS